MDIPIPLQEALRDSIISGTFIDTKFWVFSKRSSRAGRVGEPKALFVNGHVAKRVTRLGSLLDGRGTKENLRADFPEDRKHYTDDYDYEDDSDLEDDEDGVLDDAEPEDAPQVAAGKPENSFDIVNAGNSDAKNNEPSDIISVSDLDSLFYESSDTKGTGEAESGSSAHVGKVIIIQDVAYVTFQALLRYLYTNEIEFAPWGSAERRKTRAREKISESYGIPKPSPKSIYRLADKYDIPELKQLALQQIQQDLSKCDITEEVFSKYTSWYPELRVLEVRQLARDVLSSDSGPTLGLLKGKIKSYTHGRLPHADEILPALYALMESDALIKETPLPVIAPSDEQVTNGDWDRLKKALTSSLTNGTFLDSQFYAVESMPSTGLPGIRPVYFCSAVAGNFTSKLTAYSSKLRARRTPLFGCADEYDSDIDDEESNPENSMECYPSSTCIRENPIPANLPMEPALLLKSGAAKTWSVIFLWMYTGQIRFSPLASQNVIPSKTKEDQGDYSQEASNSPQDSGRFGVLPGAIAVEAGSPKSIYCLANKVGLTVLCDIAYEDIQSKLDENNIVQELFSPFTANHRRIREMEHELFQSKLKPSDDGASVLNIIRDSSSGENSHRAAAIELVLERSIQERRKRMSAKMKSTSRSEPVPQPERCSGKPDISIPRVQVPTPSPAPQPPIRSSPMTTLDLFLGSPSLSGKPATSLNSSTLSKPARKVETTRREKPPVDAETNPSPTEDTVKLICQSCNVKQRRSHLRSGVYCSSCVGLGATMKCTGCGRIRVDDIKACTKCHRKFK